MFDKVEEDVKSIKYVFENMTSIVLAFVSLGFILSLTYNFSYFNASHQIRFLTLFNFNDYVENSLVSIVLVFVFIFYSHLLSIETGGLWGRIKLIKSDLLECKKEIKGKYSGLVCWFLFLFSIFIVVTIRLVQAFGFCFPYFLIILMLYRGYEVSKEIGDAVFQKEILENLIIISMILLFIDVLIALRPKEYEVRKKVFKFFTIIMVFSFSLGLYHLADEKKVATKLGSPQFVRGIGRGAFFMREGSEGLYFVRWEDMKDIQIEVIKSL